MLLESLVSEMILQRGKHILPKNRPKHSRFHERDIVISFKRCDKMQEWRKIMIKPNMERIYNLAGFI